MPTLSSRTVPNQQKKNWTSEANMQGHKRPIDETEHYITASSAVDNEKDQTESKRVYDIRHIFELSLSALGILPIYINKALAYVIKGSSMELPSVQKQFEMLSKILRQMDAKIVEPRVKENLLGCEMAKNGTFFGQIFKKIQKQGIDVFGHNLFETDQNEEQSIKRGEILFFYMKFYNKLVKLLEQEYYGTDKNTTEIRLGLHKWIRAAKECVAGEFQQFFKMAREHRFPNSQLFPH
uniref:Uncharacterized protein n=1 Tax=Globodera rostochiensis TaxID=31243 RepID=A0A914I4E5_GLORO